MTNSKVQSPNGLILFGYRGGSQLLRQFLSTDDHPDIEWEHSQNCVWVPTKEPKTCLIEDANTSFRLTKLKAPVRCLWWMHFANQTVAVQKYVELIDDVRVVNFVRDPRNQIASMAKLKGLDSSDPKYAAWFRAQCEAFKHRVQVIQSLEKAGEKVGTFRMEDLLDSPSSKVREIYDFLELEPDRGAVRKVSWSLPNSRRHKLAHSSFGTIKGVNERWKNLDERDLELFSHIAGAEFEHLGYSLT